MHHAQLALSGGLELELKPAGIALHQISSTTQECAMHHAQLALSGGLELELEPALSAQVTVPAAQFQIFAMFASHLMFTKTMVLAN